MTAEKKKESQSYHHGNLRRVLIDTAVEIISEQGARGLSLRKVAKRAGVSHAAPYRHFKDKNAILAAVAKEGFEMMLWQKNHLESCYCLEGEGTVEELDAGKVHSIRPGTLYAMNNHDRHLIKITKRARLICTFVPALTGDEVHDEDGSL